MAAGFAGFGMKMLEQLGMNTSNRIGTGRSLRKQMLNEQVRQTRREASAGIVGRVEGAKAAGIHPLVALGSNVGGASIPVGPSFNATGDYTGAFASDAINKREMEMRREELEFQKKSTGEMNRRQAIADDLNKRETEARINYLDAQRAGELKRMADSDRDFAAAQAAHARAEASKSGPGVAAKPKGNDPMWVYVNDENGKAWRVPNPKYFSTELPESLGAYYLYRPDAVRALNAAPPTVQGWFQRQIDAARRDPRINPRNPNGLPIPVDTRP